MPKKELIDSNTRQKILDAAFEEFATKGMAGARVDTIARNANINKAMIYYHFSSKEKLYEKVIEREITSLIKGLQVELEEKSDPQKVFMTFSQQYMRVFGSKMNLVSILTREVLDGGERMRKILLKTVNRYNVPERLLGFIRQGQEAGYLRDVDPRQAMISFIGMNLFYLQARSVVNQVWEIENEDKFLEERPAQVVDLFLHGLLAR